MLDRLPAFHHCILSLALLALVPACSGAAVRADDAGRSDAARRIVLISGPSGYPAGIHAYNAGVALFEACLREIPGVTAVAHTNGWPADPAAIEGADAILLFMNGGGGHEILQEERLQQVGRLIDAGGGLGAIHYALDVPPDRGATELLDWLGGFYEGGFSVNPTWVAEFETIPSHPVTRGVRPFTLRDEWYFSIRFRADMDGVTPLLQARPSDETRAGPYASPPGPYPHIVEAAGRLETVAWVRERAGGGRGFGYTGGHFHAAWDDVNARRLVLNALLWLAGADVPEAGVVCDIPADSMLGPYPNR